MNNPVTIKSYQDAEAYLNGQTEAKLPGKGSKIKRVAPNAIAIDYRGTAVVTYFAENIISLNSGGWFSNTTLSKMNTYLPSDFLVTEGQAKVWTVKHLPTGAWGFFCDGFLIDLNLKALFTNAKDTDVLGQVEMLHKVKEYIEFYLEEVTTGNIALRKDIPALEITADEQMNGEIAYPTKEQVAKIIKAENFSPSILRRAVMVEGSKEVFIELASEVTTLTGELWSQSAIKLITAPTTQREFRKVLRRMLHRSLELPL